MKKYLLWLGIVLSVSGIAAYKPLREAFDNKTKDENISFVIYKGNNYTSEVYNCTFVQVHIIVEKVKGRKRMVVWDKTYDAKLMKQFPLPKNAFTQSITVPNIMKQEHLEANYILTYNSNGSELQIQRSMIIVGDDGVLGIII